MLLEHPESTITNLVEQTANFVSDVIMIHNRSKPMLSRSNKGFSAHGATIVLQSEKVFELLLAHIVPKVSMPS